MDIPANWFRPKRSDCKCGSYEPPHDLVPWDVPVADFSGGQFSFSAVRGATEVYCDGRVDTARDGVFVGIHEGYQSATAPNFAVQALMDHFVGSARNCDGVITEQVLRDAIIATKRAFTQHVTELGGLLARASCYIVGIIWNGTLYVANLGGSGPVLGYYNTAEMLDYKWLTDDGSVNECLRAYDNPTFESCVDPLWLSNAETEIPRDIQVFSKPIGDEDKFLIFASSGLWKYLTSEEAVQIVHRNPRRGSAKGLAIKAMQKAAEKSGRNYDEMKRNPDEDIMVVVIFLGNGPMISYVGSECTLAHGENRMPSQFGLWEEGSSSDVSKERGSTSNVSNEKGSTSGVSKGKGSTSGVSKEKGSNSTSS